MFKWQVPEPLARAELIHFFESHRLDTFQLVKCLWLTIGAVLNLHIFQFPDAANDDKFRFLFFYANVSHVLKFMPRCGEMWPAKLYWCTKS